MTPLPSRSDELMPVAHYPAAANACATKFWRAYPHRMIAGGIGPLPQEQAFGDVVLQLGRRGT
jgi:hypothetical protein